MNEPLPALEARIASERTRRIMSTSSTERTQAAPLQGAGRLATPVSFR